MIPERVKDRFWARVETGAPDECWLWKMSTTKAGYGQIGWHDGKTVTALAHRVAYELSVGPIPEGLVLDHLCRTPRCCNPAHLEAVTQRENIMRGTSPVARLVGATHCKNGHEWNEQNTWVRREGTRECRACRRDALRRFAARKREAV